MTEPTPHHDGPDEPAPWWFSGAGEPEPNTPEPIEPSTTEPVSDTPSDEPEPDETDEAGPGLAEVVAGIGTLVGWARARVIDPHLEHTDPAEHPDCFICRGMTVVQRLAEQDRAAGTFPDGLAADGAGEPIDDGIAWLPLTRKGRADRTRAHKGSGGKARTNKTTRTHAKKD